HQAERSPTASRRHEWRYSYRGGVPNRGWRRARRSLPDESHREPYAHRRAGADRRRDLNGSVVVRHDPVDDGKAEPRPLFERAVERLEEAVKFGWRDAAAFVLDRNAQFFLAAASLALRRQQETATR